MFTRRLVNDWGNMNMSENGFYPQEDAIEAALRAAARRGWSDVIPGYEDILAAEEDVELDAGDYEMRQRALGARAILQWIVAEGLHPMKLVRRLLVVGRFCGVEPFSLLTMEQAGALGMEGKASHSHRCKLLSEVLRSAGMRGTKAAGMKSDEACKAYAEAQLGNRNRAGSNHREHKEHKNQ